MESDRKGRLQLVVVWSASPKPSTMTTLRLLRSAANAQGYVLNLKENAFV